MNRLSMSTVLVALLLTTIAGCADEVGTAETTNVDNANVLTEEELAEGWILLFDGETLFGWQAANDSDWKAAAGVISAGKGTPGLLHTTSQFGNYVLKLDFRSVAGGNSGVFLRTTPEPTDVTKQCYELNIADWDDNDFPTGSFVQRKKCETQHDSTDWQSLEVTADGPRFIVKLDGQQILDYTDPEPTGRGFIGLQYRKGLIQFRNIKLKPLGAKSLFNGKDLSGWKTYPNMASVFSVKPDGWMHAAGGPGQLETEGAYGDFTLQLEARTNAKGLNSGIFFRCIPAEEMNGYECQIDNDYKDGDRSKPDDCGTGGIFRRQNARKVVPDDMKPFYMTIHTDGPHMATWVNGYQVCDWTDTREPNPNPRRGLRLEPGTIIIQGHDPTTDLSFRNFNLSPLPQRVVR